MPADYTLMDATLEILLMLLAAFLLGWLFCWLIKKLFGGKPSVAHSQNINANDDSMRKPATTGIVSSNRERLYNTDSDLDTELSAPDLNAPDINLNEVDLPKQAPIVAPAVNLATPEISKPRPRIDLPDFNTPEVDIQEKLSAGINTGKASLGEGLGALSGGLGAIAVGASAFKDKAVENAESLNPDSIETPDISINAPDIPSSDAVVESLDIDVDNIAAELDLPEIDHTDFDTEIDLPDIPEMQTPIEDLDLKDSLSTPNVASSVNTEIAEETHTSDDLTRISGIDKNVVSILNDQGIVSYDDLQKTNRSQLKGYLDATGDSKLSELEPASWPHQATLCENRNWSKLNEYQSFLTGSNLDTRQTVASETSSSGDDLKKVEGIGPFFESLLNDAGITTYEQLKNSDRDTLKEIIDAAGPDYRMHEPETWPYQAGLAHNGEWKKLQDYIQFMTGRS